MSSVDCAAFNSFNSDVCLPPSKQAPAPETGYLDDQTPRPAVWYGENTLQEKPEILVPGKNWEYIAAYPLHQLKPHPWQKNLFVGLNEAGIVELAADIRKRGLQNPLEILADGTIVNGHQRVRACEQLGWDHLPVYIRHDFAQQPKTAVQEHIVQDNLQRKHLHPLEIARGYLQLRTSFAEQQAAGEDYPFALQDLRRDLGQRFGISGRTLDRYVAALKAPSIIQDGCIRGRIPLQLVCKIGRLSRSKIIALMERIENGENLCAVVEEYTRPKQGEQDRATKALLALTRQLTRGIAEIEENLDKLPYKQPDLQRCRPALEQARDFLTSLLEFYKNPPLNERVKVLRAQDEEKIIAELNEHAAHNP
jgi:hypothetical protein